MKNYLWRYTDGKTVLYEGHDEGKVPVSNGLSERISKDLKKRGFKFIGDGTMKGKVGGVRKAPEHFGIKTLRDTMLALDEGAVVCNTGVSKKRVLLLTAER